MPALRTDDGPRRLRAVWLGPKGGTLPFEWTYVQWLVTLLCVVVLAVVGAVLVHLAGAPGWAQVLTLIYGGAAGVVLAVKVMRNVTFDEPLKHKTATARAEFARTLQPAQQPVAWTWPALPIADLSPAATQILIPRKDT